MSSDQISVTTKEPAAGFAWLWALLTRPHPSVQEIEERTRAQLLSILTLILTVIYVGAILSGPTSYAIFVILLVVTIATYGLSRTPYFRIGIYFFCFSFTAFAYLTLPLGMATSFSSALTTSVHVSLVVASILLSPRSLAFLVFFVAIASVMAPRYSQVPIAVNTDFYKDTGVTVAIGVILIGATTFRTFIEKARLRELNEVNLNLSHLMSNLEERVTERTAEIDRVNQQTMRRASQLQAVTALSESIAQLHDINQLLPGTARLISERFGFYHVGIFLLDQEHEFAVLQAANSEGGQRMLERRHRLRLGIGVVGFSAQTGQPRIALDVGRDAVFFNNPDLPDTRSEVALPLRSRGETIGVLDVQSTEAGAFSSEDLQVLTALANQVSIALENAQLLTETRAALMQVQEVYNEFTRTEWSRTVAQAEQRGFRYQMGRIEMVDDGLQDPEAASAVQSGAAIIGQSNGSPEKRPVVAVPVTLRGEVIGILHVESNDPLRQWQRDEISLVQAVAERAALAMENARLFQDARRRAAKERLISDASARISGALNIENILRTTAEELERVLGGSEILIQFQNKELS